MLKDYLAEAKHTLIELAKVADKYEHRMDVVHEKIDDLKKELDVLMDEVDGIYSMTRSLDYDIDCVINDEDPSGHYIHAIKNGSFNMPTGPSCDCLVCKLKKWGKL